jgi:hypothetical protein
MYVNLYSGPDYFIYNSYSSLLNVIFFTFMFGIAMPLIFPLGLLYIVIFYFFERVTITYFYQKPPMYDEKINGKVLELLKWAPIVMMCFNYWVFGNQQLFAN